MGQRTLIVISGPTASGKTSLAIAVARYFQTAILSADSRQFYRELNIGTARPTAGELAAAPHYFVADRSLETPLAAGAYAEEAQELLRSLFETHSVVVCVGGSGLFVHALTKGFDPIPPVEESIRRQVDALFDQEGIAGLQQLLAQLDPTYYTEVDLQNPARLKRALEVSIQTKKPYSSFLDQTSPKSGFRSVFLCPFWSRPALYERIDRRVDQMIERGLEREVKQVLSFRERPVFRTVGYQEWLPYFDGKIGREEVIQLIKRNSRRYAKRQRTWLRRDGYYKFVPPGDPDWSLRYLRWSLSSQMDLSLQLSDQKKVLSFSSSDGPKPALIYTEHKQYWQLIEDRCGDRETARYYLLHELFHRSAELGLSLRLGTSDLTEVYQRLGARVEGDVLSMVRW